MKLMYLLHDLGAAGIPAYCASKFAVRGLVESLRLEVGNEFHDNGNLPSYQLAANQECSCHAFQMLLLFIPGKLCINYDSDSCICLEMGIKSAC